MTLVSLVSGLLKLFSLARTYGPVIAAVAVLLSKVVTGDQSGATEALSMVIAAWASINSGAKTVKAVKSIAESAAPSAGSSRIDAGAAPTFDAPRPSVFLTTAPVPPLGFAADDRRDHPHVL